MSDLSWDDFRLIKAIADAKNLSGAAATLKINHSTVFRQLGQVEQKLGMALFERRRNGYILTPAGHEMASLAERMEGEIIGFSRKMSEEGQIPSGALRVTTNDIVLTTLLLPLVPNYLDAYPRINLEIIQTNQALSLTKSDADIAIRATDTPPENLVGRKIGPIGWAIYGHGADFALRETLPEMQELLSLRWVGFGDNLMHSKPWRYLMENVNPAQVRLKLNSVLGVMEAVKERAGISALPCHVGDKQKDLVRLSRLIPELETGLWLLTHADLRHGLRVRSFMDFIGTELSQQKTRLEGRA